MIDQSFIFLDNVGVQTEQKIWNKGVHTWDQFLCETRVAGISSARKTMYNLMVQKAKKNLEVRNFPYFCSHFPASEHWRLFDTFKDDVVYVDIETTGLYGDITVIGIYDGEHTKTLVRGRNLSKEGFLQCLEGKKMMVTFNGSSFDIPIIERFLHTSIDLPHIDLRHVCAKIGLVGGLKSIEQQLGIQRREEIQGMSGYEAVYLWNMYTSTGEEPYLEKLVQYNEADIVNLVPLAEYAIPRLWGMVRKKLL